MKSLRPNGSLSGSAGGVRPDPSLQKVGQTPPRTLDIDDPQRSGAAGGPQQERQTLLRAEVLECRANEVRPPQDGQFRIRADPKIGDVEVLGVVKRVEAEIR